MRVVNPDPVENRVAYYWPRTSLEHIKREQHTPKPNDVVLMKVSADDDVKDDGEDEMMNATDHAVAGVGDLRRHRHHLSGHDEHHEGFGRQMEQPFPRRRRTLDHIEIATSCNNMCEDDGKTVRRLHAFRDELKMTTQETSRRNIPKERGPSNEQPQSSSSFREGQSDGGQHRQVTSDTSRQRLMDLMDRRMKNLTKQKGSVSESDKRGKPVPGRAVPPHKPRRRQSMPIGGHVGVQSGERKERSEGTNLMDVRYYCHDINPGRRQSLQKMQSCSSVMKYASSSKMQEHIVPQRHKNAQLGEDNGRIVGRVRRPSMSKVKSRSSDDLMARRSSLDSGAPTAISTFSVPQRHKNVQLGEKNGRVVSRARRPSMSNMKSRSSDDLMARRSSLDSGAPTANSTFSTLERSLIGGSGGHQLPTSNEGASRRRRPSLPKLKSPSAHDLMQPAGRPTSTAVGALPKNTTFETEAEFIYSTQTTKQGMMSLFPPAGSTKVEEISMKQEYDMVPSRRISRRPSAGENGTSSESKRVVQPKLEIDTNAGTATRNYMDQLFSNPSSTLNGSVRQLTLGQR